MKKYVETNYKYIDILKLLSVFMIVSIHCKLFSDIDFGISYAINHVIFRISVPIFLFSTGFFIAEKILDKSYMKKYLFRILKLYVVWTIMNLPLILKELLLTNNSIIENILLFFRNFFIVGSYTQLWYLLGTIYGIAIIIILLKLSNNSYKLLLSVAIITLLIGIFANSVIPILNNDIINSIYEKYVILFGTTRNGLFFCFPCIFFGIILKKYRLYKIISLKLNILIIILLYFICGCIEYNIFQYTYRVADYTSLSILSSFFIFLLMININFKVKTKNYSYESSKKMRKYITFTFGNHLLIYYFVKYIFDYFFIESTILIYVFVLCLNTIEFIILYRLKDKLSILNNLW